MIADPSYGTLAPIDRAGGDAIGDDDSTERRGMRTEEETRRWLRRLEIDGQTDGFKTEYWGRRAFWSIDECLALVLKRDPDKLREFNLDEVIQIASFGRDLVDMRERIEAAMKDGQLSRIRPIVFLTWARGQGVQLRYALEKEIEACEVDVDSLRDHHERVRQENRRLRYEIDRLKGSALQKGQKEKASQDLTPRERSSLLKMVIAMAITKYGYDRYKKTRPQGTLLTRSKPATCSSARTRSEAF
jgi:hypothetical protein